MATPLDDYAYRQKAASKRLSSVMTEDERKMSEYNEKKKQQKSKGMVGGAIGGVAGAYFGGPQGAAAGYQAGSAITGGADPEKPQLTGDGEGKPKQGAKKGKKKDDSASMAKGLGALGKLVGSDDETDGGAHPPPARSTSDQDKKNKEDSVDFGAIANLIRAAYMSNGS